MIYDPIEKQLTQIAMETTEPIYSFMAMDGDKFIFCGAGKREEVYQMVRAALDCDPDIAGVFIEATQDHLVALSEKN